MKPTLIIASATAVVAIGLGVIASLPKNVSEGGESSPEELTAAMLRERTAKKVEDSAPEKRPPVMGSRVTPGKPLGASAMKALEKELTPDQLAALKEARANHVASPAEIERNQQQAARDKAMNQMREDLRTAVAVSPDDWVKTYDRLMADHQSTFGGQVGGGFGPGVDSGDGTATPPDNGEGNSLAPVNESEAVVLKEYYHSVVDRSFPPRFMLTRPRN